LTHAVEAPGDREPPPRPHDSS